MTNRLELSMAERVSFAGGQPFETTGAYERIAGRAHFAVDPTSQGAGRHRRHRQGSSGCKWARPLHGRFSHPEAGRHGQRQPAPVLRLGQPRQQALPAVLQRCAGSNDPRSAATPATASSCDAATRSSGSPGRATCSRAMAARFSICRSRRTTVGRSPGRCGSSSSPISRASPRSRSAAAPRPAVIPRSRSTPTRASLTRRRYPSDARIEVPAADWQFARVEGGSGLDNQGAERAIVPSDTHIHVPAGFETGWIYELIYEAKDPLVLGLGHVAVRDFISFLKYEGEDAGGQRQSLARAIESASRRSTAGGARRAGAASAISSMRASTRTRAVGACSMACCRMWQAPA